MQHREFEPPESLKNAIRCFWYNSRDVGEMLTGFEVQPDGYTEIIFHFGSGCSIMRNGTPELLPSPFMMGLLNQPAVFYTKNRLQIIAVRCYPWTVFDLLGLTADKTPVRILKHPIAQLQPLLDNLIGIGDIEEAIAAVSQLFLNAASKIPASSLLFKAGIFISKANGTLPVSHVAEEAHVTVRTLERKFKLAAGYTVKDVSGLMRFEQVRNHLWVYPDTNLAGLAHKLGYTDQAHLSREFKRYSGTTPAAFARKARNGKQATAGNFVAFVQA